AGGGVWQVDLAQALLGRVEVPQLRLPEPGLAGEQLERLGHERLRVRQVGEVVAKRERRERVDRLRDEEAAGAELRRRELEQADERGRRQMLHDLAREDAAQRAVLRALEVGEQVGLLDRKTLSAGESDHVRVGVHTTGLDPGLTKQPDELAAAAADVEHRRGLAEVLDVRALALAD